MQLLINVQEESPDSLLKAASVLMMLAGADELAAANWPRNVPRPAPKPLHPPAPPIGPAQTPGPTIPLPPGSEPPPPVEHPPVHPDVEKFVPPAPPETPPDVPAGTQDELDPAAVFGGAPATPTNVTAAAAPAAPPAGAPAAGSPTATAPASASPGATVELAFDKAGIPWDERVHSETKKQNADGTWRFRRNLDPGVKDSVMAELRAKYGPQQQVSLQQPAAVITSALPVPPAQAAVSQQSAAAASVPAPPVPAAGDVPAPPADVAPPPLPNNNVVSLHAGQTSVGGSAAVPMPPATSVGVPNAGQSAVVQATNFRALMQKVNTALAAGKLTQDQLTEACKANQVEGITALAVMPAKVPEVDAYLNRWLAA